MFMINLSILLFIDIHHICRTIKIFFSFFRKVLHLSVYSCQASSNNLSIHVRKVLSMHIYACHESSFYQYLRMTGKICLFCRCHTGKFNISINVRRVGHRDMNTRKFYLSINVRRVLFFYSCHERSIYQYLCNS